MSEIKTEIFQNLKHREIDLNVTVPHDKLNFNSYQIVNDVKQAVAEAIYKSTVDRIIPRIKEAIDKALAEEFGGREKSGERKGEEGSEKAGDGKAGEVFSLWRIDVLDEECVGAKRCKHSYAWSRSSDGARRLFQHYYKNCHIEKIEEVFSGYPGHFLTQLDSDGTLRSLNVFILPPLD